jgi:hypothetical protein
MEFNRIAWSTLDLCVTSHDACVHMNIFAAGKKLCFLSHLVPTVHAVYTVYTLNMECCVSYVVVYILYYSVSEKSVFSSTKEEHIKNGKY